jgi:hypothetical protein
MESAALDSRPELVEGRGNDNGKAPAGHGLHRSVSARSLDGVEVNRKDTTLVLGPRAARTRGAAPGSFKSSLLNSTAAFTRPLRVFAPLRSNPSCPTAAGHEVDRSFPPLARRTPPTPAAPSASRPAPAARSSRARRLAAA